MSPPRHHNPKVPKRKKPPPVKARQSGELAYDDLPDEVFRYFVVPVWNQAKDSLARKRRDQIESFLKGKKRLSLTVKYATLENLVDFYKGRREFELLKGLVEQGKQDLAFEEQQFFGIVPSGDGREKPKFISYEKRKEGRPQSEDEKAISLDRISDKPGRFHHLFELHWEDIKDWTSRQLEWGDAYRSLGNRPSAAAVGRKLGISRSASAAMKRRIESSLEEAHMSHRFGRDIDQISEEHVKGVLRDIRDTPEYLELEIKDKGKKEWKHWKLNQYGLGYKAVPIQSENELEGLFRKKLPIKCVRTHTPSVLNQWWDKKISKFASEKNIPYGRAYVELMAHYHKKWPENLRLSECRCRFCGDLLPLGEVIEGKRVTTQRKFCSDRCKTYSKRYRRI